MRIGRLQIDFRKYEKNTDALHWCCEIILWQKTRRMDDKENTVEDGGKVK